MKLLRPFISFNYDLRKPLSTGQKAAISRAWEDVTPYKNQRYIRFRKHKDETNNQFKRRVKRTKENLGQQDNKFGGIFVEMPKEAKVRFTKSGLIAKYENFKERYVSANQELLATDPEAEADRVFNNYKFDFLFFDHSGFRSFFSVDSPDLFLMKLNQFVMQYRQVINHAVSGYILRTETN